MPAKGRVLVVVGDWVTRTAIQATRGELEREDLRIRLKAIRQFEETLLANGVALAKIWLTTTRKSLRRRLRDAEDTDAEGWVVTEDDLRLSDGKGAKAATDCRRHASPTGHAWHKVPAAEFKRRDLLAQSQRRYFNESFTPLTAPSPWSSRSRCAQRDGSR
jgi:polyphosphate kinase 2 (PPK2 family)